MRIPTVRRPLVQRGGDARVGSVACPDRGGWAWWPRCLAWSAVPLALGVSPILTPYRQLMPSRGDRGMYP